MNAMWTRRARWIGLAAAAALLTGCGATQAGSAQVDSSDLSMTSGTSTAEDTTTAGGAGTGTGTGEAGSSSGAATSETLSDQTTSTSAVESTDPAGPAADCGQAQGWDTTAKRADFRASGAIIGVTAEAVDCADSVIIWIKPADAAPGYTVEYVPEVVMDGSGLPVPLTSAAKLQVMVTTPAYEDDGTKITSTFEPADKDHVVETAGLAVVEQVAYAGSFEGQTTFGIGVSAERPFTVTTDRGDDGSTTLTVSIANS